MGRRQGHFCRAASSRPLPASGGPFSGPATSFAFPPQSSSAAMLSRALLRAGLARNALSQVRPVSTTSAKAGSIPAWVDGVDIFENEKNPERDHVNFPRRKREELPSPVRHWWIPEEYFSFFAPKTGVTGGYIFALSFGSFLCSKEYIIFEHEMHVGMVFAIAIVGVANIVGPALTKSLDATITRRSPIWIPSVTRRSTVAPWPSRRRRRASGWPDHTKTSSQQRRRTLHSSWKRNTGPGSRTHSHRLSGGWITSSRQQTCCEPMNRNTWSIGSLPTSRRASQPSRRKTRSRSAWLTLRLSPNFKPSSFFSTSCDSPPAHPCHNICVNQDSFRKQYNIST